MLVENVERAITSNVFPENEEQVGGIDFAARAAIEAVFDWQLTQTRDPVVIHSLAAMRKEALSDG